MGSEMEKAAPVDLLITLYVSIRHDDKHIALYVAKGDKWVRLHKVLKVQRYNL